MKDDPLNVEPGEVEREDIGNSLFALSSGWKKRYGK